MNEHLLAEKTEKCAELRWRREQLENERVRILNNLDNIRKGEVNPLKRGEGINFGLLSAKNIVGQGANSGAPVLSSLADDPEARDRYLSRIPGMRDKLKADEERLQQLKEQHMNLYKREAMPFDEDELKIKQNRDNKGAADKMAIYFNQVMDRDKLGIGNFREGIEKVATRYGEGDSSGIP